MINSTVHGNQDGQESLSACSEALSSRKLVTGFEYTPGLFIPLYSILSFVTFSGNFLILLVLHKVSSIHPPSRALLRCLLITDLCVGLVSQPLFVSYLMAIEEKNRSLCIRIEDLTFAVNSVLIGRSITTLTTISVDRLLALRLGIRYRQVVTLARVRLLVTMLWIWNIALPFAHYWGKLFVSLLGCGWIFVCLIISSCCYFKIYQVLGYRQVKVASGPAQIQDPAVKRTNPRVLQVFNISRYKKTVSNAIWVHSILVICYLPFAVATAVTALRGEPLNGTRNKL